MNLEVFGNVTKHCLECVSYLYQKKKQRNKIVKFYKFCTIFHFRPAQILQNCDFFASLTSFLIGKFCLQLFHLFVILIPTPRAGLWILET